MNKKQLRISFGFVIVLLMAWGAMHLKTVYASALAINDQSNTKTAKTTASSVKSFTIQPPIVTILPNTEEQSLNQNPDSNAARTLMAAVPATQPSWCTSAQAQVRREGNLVWNGDLSNPDNVVTITNLIHQFKNDQQVRDLAACVYPEGWKAGCPDQYCTVNFSAASNIVVTPVGVSYHHPACSGETSGTVTVTRSGPVWTEQLMSDEMYKELVTKLDQIKNDFKCTCNVDGNPDDICFKSLTAEFSKLQVFIVKGKATLILTVKYSIDCRFLELPGQQNTSAVSYLFILAKECKEKPQLLPPTTQPAPADPVRPPVDPPRYV